MWLGRLAALRLETAPVLRRVQSRLPSDTPRVIRGNWSQRLQRSPRSGGAEALAAPTRTAGPWAPAPTAPWWCHGTPGGAVGPSVVPWSPGGAMEPWWCCGTPGGAVGPPVVPQSPGGATGARGEPSTGWSLVAKPAQLRTVQPAHPAACPDKAPFVCGD